MKRKSVSLLLALTLVLSFLPAASAAESATPTPPEWINEEDYLVFPGDEVYESENWAKVEELREGARNGGTIVIDGSQDWAEGSPGMCYETGLVRIKYGLNAKEEGRHWNNAFYSAGRAFSAAQGDYWGTYGKEKDELYYRLDIEKLRAWAISSATYVSDWKQSLSPALEALNMTLEDFLAGQYMYLCDETRKNLITEKMETPETKSATNYNWAMVELFVDGKEPINKLVLDDAPPEVKNQRIMVPVRAVAVAIGADVEWVQETRQIIMTRAGVTVTMTLDSTTATIDGQTVEMDVAPYAVRGRTLLPARYVAEFFGQNVEWDGEKRHVLITEDKSAAGNSNLEAWAMAMGLIYAYQRYGERCSEKEDLLFGMYPRTAANVQSARGGLNQNWGGDSREHIISIVESMTAHGHNDSFQAAAKDANSLTSEEMAYLISISSSTDQYMWPYTKALSEKWGEKGILAWDLSRMGAMVQWGYHAGRLTYEEALALVEPAARLTAENFSSWEEFYENYLDGYNWWARNNVVGKDPWETERGPLCRKMMDDPILDDTLFQTGVIGLPNDSNA